MYSSSYYARLIAEVAVVLADPQIACHPAAALAGVSMQELIRCYVEACKREQALEVHYQRELDARLPEPVRALMARAA